jgi:hypothetical protein
MLSQQLPVLLFLTSNRDLLHCFCLFQAAPTACLQLLALLLLLQLLQFLLLLLLLLYLCPLLFKIITLLAQLLEALLQLLFSLLLFLHKQLQTFYPVWCCALLLLLECLETGKFNVSVKHLSHGCISKSEKTEVSITPMNTRTDQEDRQKRVQ